MKFATVYTDASFSPTHGTARVAFIARTEGGWIEEFKDLHCRNIHDAEMTAIKFAVERCVSEWPEIGGVYINCDNLGCVERFWPWKKHRRNPMFDNTRDDVLKTLESRWIRTKHVKAHTGNKDIRSFMNKLVDRMTRRKF